MGKYENEADLIQAFKGRDPGAEAFIFQKLFRSMCLLAETITGHLPAAEDIVAEAFIKLFDKRAEFEHMDNIKAYLYIAVRNGSYTYTTTQKRRAVAHLKLATAQEETAVPAASPEDLEIIRVQLLEAIYQEIENLPRQCRRISKLIFFDGKSTEEVALALGISRQTVRSQKARAIQLLKNQLFNSEKFASFLLLSAYWGTFWDK